MSSLSISLSTQENSWNQATCKLIWHWELDFKEALMIFCVMWAEVLYLQFATWFHFVLNLLEFWPIDLVELENV